MLPEMGIDPYFDDLNIFWSIVSIAYFIGGLGLGYIVKGWKEARKRKFKRGTGRWDNI